MTLSVKHAFNTTKGDGPDSTRVRPTNWNAEHVLTTDGDGVVLGRPAGAGPGPVVDVPVSSLFPTGAVIDFAGATAPTGWLLCYGQELSRTVEAALFAVIGTAYGAGDGATTFKLPDCRGVGSSGKTNMGGADKGNLAGGAVLGALLGGQYNNIGLNLGGSIVNDGNNRSGGSLSVSGVTDGPPDHGDFGTPVSGGGGAAANQWHFHNWSGSTSGQLSLFANVGVSGNTGNFSVVQGTIIFNKIIKR